LRNAPLFQKTRKIRRDTPPGPQNFFGHRSFAFPGKFRAFSSFFHYNPKKQKNVPNWRENEKNEHKPAKRVIFDEREKAVPIEIICLEAGNLARCRAVDVMDKGFRAEI
jgi:hypothetical protein